MKPIARARVATPSASAFATLQHAPAMNFALPVARPICY